MLFSYYDFALRLVSRTRSTATTTTARSGTPTATPAAVVIRSRTGRTSTTRSKSGLPRGLWSNAVGRIEVRLILLVELLAIRLFQILATLDQNGALVGAGLALVELMPRPRRSRTF